MKPTINLAPLLGIALILIVLLMTVPVPSRYLVTIRTLRTCKPMLNKDGRKTFQPCPNE